MEMRLFRIDHWVMGCMVGFFFGCSGVSYSHDSPNDVIDALSHRIETDSASVRLLVSRAYEFRAYGDLDAAESDLVAALTMDASDVAACVALGQLYVFRNRYDDALGIVNAGMRHGSSIEDRSGLHGLAAEAHLGKGSWKAGLLEIDQALNGSPGELEWSLVKSRILSELGLYGERLEFLRNASGRNGSIVLQIELVGALRDVRRFDESIRMIEGYIEKRRWKADWYLRRAEVFVLMKDFGLACADAERALDEIDVRMEMHGVDDELLKVRARAIGILEGAGVGVVVGDGVEESEEVAGSLLIMSVE